MENKQIFLEYMIYVCKKYIEPLIKNFFEINKTKKYKFRYLFQFVKFKLKNNHKDVFENLRLINYNINKNYCYGFDNFIIDLITRFKLVDNNIIFNYDDLNINNNCFTINKDIELILDSIYL